MIETAECRNRNPHFAGDMDGRAVHGRPKLSPRQSAVAELVVAGLCDCEIGAQLGLSENTVGAYLQEVFRKFDVHSRVALASCLLRQDGPGGTAQGKLHTNVYIGRSDQP